jgi:hypothetical protein
MDDTEWLAERFEEQRPQLRGVAYRMLGSLAEADDACRRPGSGCPARRPTASRTSAGG